MLSVLLFVGVVCCVRCVACSRLMFDFIRCLLLVCSGCCLRFVVGVACCLLCVGC